MQVTIPKANDKIAIQKILTAVSLIIVVLVGIFTFFQSSVLIVSFSIFALISTAYAILRALAILSAKPTDDPTSPTRSLPKISILLPVYKEAHMVERLISYIKRTEYPTSHYEVFIICEPDDTETIHAACRLVRGNIKLFVASGAGPKTKPNALNAVLPQTTGDIITVYDAEDRPHPKQLHEAAKTLQHDPRLAVVQAPLDYHNAGDNWLTQQFALEYAALFHVWLPFLTKLDLPFPLGGTSNHIRRSALLGVGGWDAHNVTEDADLSFRFAAYGWKLGYILPPTQEEAVRGWKAWKGPAQPLDERIYANVDQSYARTLGSQK